MPVRVSSGSAKGYFGGSLIAEDQASFSCEGACPPGKMCAEEATIVPLPCPPDAWCLGGELRGCPESRPNALANSSSDNSCVSCPSNSHPDSGACICDSGFKPHCRYSDCQLSAAELVAIGMGFCRSSNFSLYQPYPLLAFILWGMPGWWTLLFIVVVARRRIQRYQQRGTLIALINDALRTVDVTEAAAHCKARQVNFRRALRLRLMARLIIGVCAPALPWLPAVRAIYVFYPIATMHVENDAFPPDLRRRQLQHLRHQVLVLALLSGFCYPPWMCAFVAGREGAKYLLMWVLLVVDWVSGSGCISSFATDGTTRFSLKQDETCQQRFDLLATVSIAQASLLLLLANLCVVFICQLGRCHSAATAPRNVWINPRRRRGATLLATLWSSAFFLPLLPVVSLATSEGATALSSWTGAWLGYVRIAMPICFIVLLPLLSGIGVYLLSRKRSLNVFEELFGSGGDSSREVASQAAGSDMHVGEGRTIADPLLGVTVPDHGRFVGNAHDIVVGRPEAAARGIWHFIRAEEHKVYEVLQRGTACVVDEWGRAEQDGSVTSADMKELRYVLESPAGSSDEAFQYGWQRDRAADGSLLAERTRPDGTGMLLEDFARAPAARQAGLTLSHVLALRLYTTSAFRSINDPLRKLRRHPTGRQADAQSLEHPHPLPCTVFLIYDGLVNIDRWISKPRPFP